ncbi:hypothetical protein QQ045_008185 [Rhodiola kirilowii]
MKLHNYHTPQLPHIIILIHDSENSSSGDDQAKDSTKVCNNEDESNYVMDYILSEAFWSSLDQPDQRNALNYFYEQEEGLLGDKSDIGINWFNDIIDMNIFNLQFLPPEFRRTSGVRDCDYIKLEIG